MTAAMDASSTPRATQLPAWPKTARQMCPPSSWLIGIMLSPVTSNPTQPAMKSALGATAASAGRSGRTSDCTQRASGGIAKGVSASGPPPVRNPSANSGTATASPASGPATAISKSCRRLARAPSMPITAPRVPVSRTGTGMKNGSVAGMRWIHAAMKWPASCAVSTAITAAA